MKKNQLVLLLFAAFTFFALSGCSDKRNKSESASLRKNASETNVQQKSKDDENNSKSEDENTVNAADMISYFPERSTLSITEDNDVLNLLRNKSLSQNSVTAHKKYLNDEMKFSEYDMQGFESDDYVALVCSDECEFFSDDNFEIDKSSSDCNLIRMTIKDRANLKGEHIPLGTMLTFDGSNYFGTTEQNEWYQEEYGYFYLWGEYNYFYKTTWNGKEGFVFGADIERRGKAKDIVRYAEKYLSDGRSDLFYPVEGLNSLSDEEVLSLEENRLAFETVSKFPWNLRTDELISKYLEYCSPDGVIPVFITTDFVSHAQHKFFDKLLESTEENYFAPRLLSLTQNFIAALKVKENVPEDIKTKAIEYFQVPELILRSAPVRKQDNEWPYGMVYFPVDNSGFINEYSEAVQKDYNQVMNACGGELNIFDSSDDFTQYKPRGHYTTNGLLEAYFRAEMWYGRIHLALSADDKQSSELETIAMLVVDTVKDNPELYDQWADLFDPITELIGLSDDLGFNDVLPLWKDQNVSNFSEWSSDPEKLSEFASLCHEKLRPPALKNYITETDNNNMGLRLLGQRFTWDSYVHDSVSHPQLKYRYKVRGLDIMKAFGSSSADALLASEDYRNELVGEEDSFAGGSLLKNELDNFEKKFNEMPDSFWTETYYNAILAEIKTQADFESGSGYYFTESPLWNIKSLNSACSTWAELRHDTILYVKQAGAAERSGGDFDPTYRTKPLPLPVNYLEPNIPFWTYGLSSIINLSKVYTKYGLLDEKTKTQFENFIDLYKNALEVSELEAQDKPVSVSQNKWIRSIPALCNSILFPGYTDYVTDEDQLKMACIADVFTTEGEVLEVGVGQPLKMFVALNDGQGGKRIAVGFVPSYCEFYHSQNDRMTDEQWKEIVYDDNTDISKYYPFWMQGNVIQR